MVRKSDIINKSKLKRRFWPGWRKLFRILAMGFIVAIIYFSVDYVGPAKIRLTTDEVFGFNCQRARDLIVQEFDNNGDLWATRGMIIYKLKEGETKFNRVAHIPTGLNLFWLRNFSIVRKLTIRPECVEMIHTDNGDICAFSAGKLWVKYKGNRRFVETMLIENYGFGDQGVRNDGITSIGDGTIYFGEYFQNVDKNKVRVFKSVRDLSDWEIAYEFKPGEIRHIHAVQIDPYSGNLWICTGDGDLESKVAWSDDQFNTLQIIGHGSQQWRVCQLVFTEESVYWGTDNGNKELAGIYQWSKQNGDVQKLMEVDGAVFYGTRLSNGLIVMSTDREGMDSELDDRTRLFILDDDNHITTIEGGTWNHNKPGFWFKFAKLRFQRNQGSPYLAISVLNQKELPDGDLILIHEDTIQTAAHEMKDK